MVTKKIGSLLSLKKSRKTLLQVYKLYKRKARFLSAPAHQTIQTHLTSLKTALLEKDSANASRIAMQLQEMSSKLLPKTGWDKVRDSILAIGSALLIALVIRQTWFEPYTIPTGSMRPTLKENDTLVTSKNDYGINIPLTTSHLHFDPSLVKRGSIVVFTGKNMDIPNVDTMYFYLFPGKKMFVKRLIGKPGDTLYFYGGQIYGINAQGDDLKELRDPEWFQNLEHIPFIRFDGKAEVDNEPHYGIFSPVVIHQMNQPVAKLSINPFGKPTGEMLTPVPHYADLWGFKNYAMARLLTPLQVEQIHPGTLKDLENAPLYLELAHHPSISEPVLIRDEYNRLRPDIGYSVSLLPLGSEHIAKIGDHITTCRFIVKNGLASRYGSTFGSHLPALPGVPDGTYEFQDGKVYRVLLGGVTSELPSDHPIYPKTADQVQLLYNLGIEFLDFYNPSKHSKAHPSRYAYFRDQKLYLLGAPILEKDDPILVRFLQREHQKQSISTSLHPYFPFEDTGPPLTKEGKIDVAFIKKYGFTLPEKKYMALGDNHAMSADSRAFGLVPQENLRGGPSFLFWPPGPRWGRLPQPAQPHITLPNLAVLGAAALAGLASFFYARRRFQKPLKFWYFLP